LKVDRRGLAGGEFDGSQAEKDGGDGEALPDVGGFHLFCGGERSAEWDTKDPVCGDGGHAGIGTSFLNDAIQA